MRKLDTPSNDAIISDTLGCPPDMAYESPEHDLRLCRWRQFIGSYALPALPHLTYVAHLGGKSNVRMWDDGAWSPNASKPSNATTLPGGRPSRWLVDGELDVVTVSLNPGNPQQGGDPGLHFAYADPLGIALIRQILSVLYEKNSLERDAYVEALMVALRAHLRRGGGTAPADIPSTLSCAHRLHPVLARIREHPEAELSIELLAQEAGLAPSHFSRMFHRAMGVPPHQYVMRTRIERAENMLGQSDLSVSSIADSLGFKSQAHFTRAFRQRTGQTPSDYRGRIRTKD
jgi:AraC family transcriptional regulator